MFSDNEPSCLSAHLSFSVINVKEDSFLMVHITHVPGKFLPRNNLHLLSSVCLCGLFHSGVIYCSTISLALISHSSDWDVIFFLRMSAPWKLKVFFGSAWFLLGFYLLLLFLLFLWVCLPLRCLQSLPSLSHTHTKISRFYAVNLKYTRYKCSAWKRLLSANDCRKYSFKTIRECSQGMDEDASPELSQTLWISAEVISMITFANYVLIYHTALNVYTALGIMKLHIWFLYTVKFIPPSPHR